MTYSTRLRTLRPGAGPRSRAMLAIAAGAGDRRLQDHPAGDITGSLSAASDASAQTEETRTAVDAWGDRYRAKSERSRHRRSAMPRRCAPPASARRRLPCSSSRRCTIPTIGRARRLRPRARRHRHSSSRRSTCSAARTRRTSRTGASCPCRVPCSTRWAGTQEAQRYYTTALKIGPTSRRCCPISACPTRCPRIWAKPSRRCGGPSAQPKRRSARPPEPRAGRRPAGPLPGSRVDRASRPADRRSGRQRRLSRARCSRSRTARSSRASRRQGPGQRQLECGATVH